MADSREQKKQLIIHTAAKLFKKYGFEKTSLHDIATAMGKSRTSVYPYFKNKEELFIAHVENKTQPYFAELVVILRGENSVIEKIKAFNRIKFSFIDANQTDYMQMNKEIIRNHALKASLLRITAEKEIKLLKDILLLGIKNGELNNLSPKKASLIASIFHTSMSAVIADLFMKDEIKNFIPTCEILEDMLIQLLEK